MYASTSNNISELGTQMCLSIGGPQRTYNSLANDYI